MVPFRPAASLRPVPFLALLLLLPGCSGGGGGEDGTGAATAGAEPLPGVRQVTYRVRADAEAPLDGDGGWAAAAGEGATVEADRPFRIRFEVEAEDAEQGLRFRLEHRRNGGPWRAVPVSDFPYPPEERGTPPVAIDSIGAYADGTPTTDLLDGAGAPFVAGAGVVADSLSPTWTGARVHGEWEWPVVVRRWADGPTTNEEGDVFELRMASADGRPLGGEPARVTLRVPPGHLGGTFVETPARLGPWQGEGGDLFFVMEPTETDNVLMVVTSADGGASWREADGAGRPRADDLEGFATAVHDGTVHMLHQQSEVVWHHAFSMGGDDDGPAWVLRDEEVARPGEPPTQVAALEARSDGSLVAVYGGPERLRLRIRSPGGDWGPETVLDADVPPALSGPQTVLGRDDVVHLAYTGLDGTAWYRRIEAAGTPSPRVRLDAELATGEEEVGAVLPPVLLEPTNTVVVLYRRADGSLRARRVPGEGGEPTAPVRVGDRRVAQSPVDSDQVAADAIADGETVHLLFVDEETRDLYHVRSDGPGRWTDPVPVVEGVDAQWVRGARVVRPDGTAVYGFVYDAGSDGGSGMNRYAEVPLGR